MKSLIVVLAFFVIGNCGVGGGFDNGNNGGVGKGGSINTMTIIGDHLFSVNSDRIDNFKIDADGNMELLQQIDLDSNLETIYPFGEYILIGSQFGMFMYELKADGQLSYVSRYQHVRSCDPVVAEGDYAYVTLNNTTGNCGTGVNELHILDINEPKDPNLIASYDLVNPLGLGVSGKLLFVCDQQAGLKVLDVGEPNDIKILDHIPGVYAKDVIVVRNLVLLITKDSLIEYAYSADGKLTRLSELKLKV